jgi:hypothetical protein
VDGADASALNGFNAQAGGSASGSFFSWQQKVEVGIDSL